RVEEGAVSVWVRRQLLDAQQLRADIEVVFHRQFAPRLEANAGTRGVVVAKGDIGLRLAAQHGPRDRVVVVIEDFEDRIEPRAEATGLHLEDQPFALPRCKSPELLLARRHDAAVGGAGDGNRAGRDLLELADFELRGAERSAARRTDGDI